MVYASELLRFINAGRLPGRYSRMVQSCLAGKGRLWRGWRRTTESGGRIQKNRDHHYKPSTENICDAITEDDTVINELGPMDVTAFGYKTMF